MELTNRQAVLGKIEVTEGVDVVPTGAANGLWIGNLQITPVGGGTNKRQMAYPDFGNSPEMVKDKQVMIQFDTELVGSGTPGTPPPWGAIARMCGWKETIVEDESVTYDLVSDSFESGSLYSWATTTRHKLLGARGTMGLTADKNSIPILRFNMTGRWAPAGAAAFPALTLDLDTPRLEMNNVNSDFTLHGFAAVLENLQLNTGAKVIHRDRPNAEYVAITGREAGGSVLFEAPALGTKDFIDIASKGTLGGLSFVHGTVAGNIATVLAAQSQLLEPTYQDVDGIRHLQMRVNPTRDPTNGDGDLSIALT